MLSEVIFDDETMPGHLIGQTAGRSWGIYLAPFVEKEGFLIYAEKETANGGERVRLGKVVDNIVIFDPNATSEFRIEIEPVDPVMSNLKHVKAAIAAFENL